MNRFTGTALSAALIMGFSAPCLFGSDARDDFDISSYDEEAGVSGTIVSYNRVEGLFFGVGIPREYDEFGMGSSLSFYGFAGYGFSNGEWRYKAGLSRKFFSVSSLELGFEGYDLTSTDDLWIMSKDENSLAAFVIREDFHDFYERKGYTLFAKQKIGRHFSARAEYREDDYLSMVAESPWTLFSRGKDFRDNPAVDEGKMKTGNLIVKSRRSRWLRDWAFSIELESNRWFEDEFSEFSRYVFDLRRYQNVGRNDRVNVRVRYGTIEGTAPVQKKFDLGGVSTLRGYAFKEFTDGDKMFLTNVEYVFDSGAVTGLDHIMFFDHIVLTLFADAGLVWSTDDALPRTNELMRNVGIGFGDADESFRLNFAKPLDGPEDERDIVVTFRINAAF